MFKIHFLLLTAMSISVISVFFCINKERKVQETIQAPLKIKNPLKNFKTPLKKTKNHFFKKTQEPLKENQEPLKKIPKTF